MTRILFWNINNFGSNGLFPPAWGHKRRKGNENEAYNEGPASDADAQDRIDVFKSVIADVNPDIISIAEVSRGSGAPVEGALTNDTAAIRLMRAMRADPNLANDWRLVPPIISGLGGIAEAVAVLYRTTQLTFIGPWGWGGAASGPIANFGGVGGLAHYPAAWFAGGAGSGALPMRMIGAGWPTPNVSERRLAGQWMFRNGLGARIHFPVAGTRSPFMTWFGDTTGRTIKLLSYHAPPSQRPAFPNPAQSAAGTRAIASIRELNPAVTPMVATEVRCIVGDFNVSAWNDAIDPTSYGPIRANGYIQHLNPRGRATVGTVPPAAIAPGWPEQGYYATHIRGMNKIEPNKGANPWATYGRRDDQAQGYPGFGWASRRDAHGTYDAIDNIFTQHPAGVVPPAPAFTVANPITGTPYNAIVAPPNVALGTIAVNTAMSVPAATVFGGPGYDLSEHSDEGEDGWDLFSDWDNFPKIRSLSDHLPVVVDV